jgi:hypothetical protein
MSQTEKAVQAILDAVETVQDNVPDGREKSLAITKLQEAALWISFEQVLKR